MENKLWHYRAKCVRVIDGDTLVLVMDTGFHSRIQDRVRLIGVNTPERGQPGFEQSKAFVMAWCTKAFNLTADEWPLLVRTSKGDAFGRWLAEIWTADGSRSLNAELIEKGWGDAEWNSAQR